MSELELEEKKPAVKKPKPIDWLKGEETYKSDLLGFKIPKCVEVIKARIPESKTHYYTLTINTRFPCEWDYEKDVEGKAIRGTVKCVGYEMRNSKHCVSKDVTIKEIMQLVNGKREEAELLNKNYESI